MAPANTAHASACVSSPMHASHMSSSFHAFRRHSITQEVTSMGFEEIIPMDTKCESEREMLGLQ